MVVFSITLVRHGETLYNRQKIMQGQQDIPLSDVGLQQAALVGRRLQNECFTHIFSSDLSRASQTAQTILDVNKIKKADVLQDKRLRERKFGMLEGKCSKDFIEAARAANKKPVHTYTPPGGETLEQLRERAKSFFTDLCKQLFAFINEKEDIDYTPCSIKRRHGGSLGRNSNRKYRHQLYCQRSQSFCGISSAENKNETLSTQQNLDYEKKPKHENESGSSSNSSISLVSSSESENTDKDLTLIDEEFKPFESSDSNSSGYTSQSETLASDQGSEKDEGRYNGITYISNVKGPLSSVPYGCCPNVTISPLIKHRLPSVSSISSGRNSSFDDVDTSPPSLADVLIVSHGGLMKELLLHLVDDLDCKLPAGRSEVMKICPNCSISKFTVYLQDNCDKPGLACNILFDKEHLYEMECVQSDVAL
ncbi:uncharacterized protein [Mytilus edulis]|uniref:uncharacterized protein isoform X1 n=2 Tax=Mytilus edulis TaxID=6550 RepID=UPI0039EEEDA2